MLNNKDAEMSQTMSSSGFVKKPSFVIGAATPNVNNTNEAETQS